MTTVEAIKVWAQGILGKNWRAIVTHAKNEDILEIRITPWCHALVTITAEEAEKFIENPQSLCDKQAELLAARDRLLGILEQGDS